MSWLSKPTEILKSWVLPKKEKQERINVRPKKQSILPSVNEDSGRIYRPKPHPSAQRRYIATRRRNPSAPSTSVPSSTEWQPVDRSNSFPYRSTERRNQYQRNVTPESNFDNQRWRTPSPLMSTAHQRWNGHQQQPATKRQWRPQPWRNPHPNFNR